MTKTIYFKIQYNVDGQLTQFKAPIILLRANNEATNMSLHNHNNIYEARVGPRPAPMRVRT